MKKFALILFFVSLSFTVHAFSEEIEINSEVMIVNPDKEFFVISAGEAKNVDMGDGLIVHRNGEKIAEAYIIGVRPDVSAAQILNVEDNKEILEGDSALIVKKIEKPESKAVKAPSKKRAWSPEPRPELTPGPEPKLTKQGDTVSIEIDKDSKAVFYYTSMLLKENGYSIISSSRTTGTLLATKPVNLSLLKELVADAFAAIDHKAAISIQIKGEGDSSVLTASSFMEHSQKNKYIKRPVTRNSRYYNDMADLMSKIKQRSEH